MTWQLVLYVVLAAICTGVAFSVLQRPHDDPQQTVVNIGASALLGILWPIVVPASFICVMLIVAARIVDNHRASVEEARAGRDPS